MKWQQLRADNLPPISQRVLVWGGDDVGPIVAWRMDCGGFGWVWTMNSERENDNEFLHWEWGDSEWWCELPPPPPGVSE